MLGAVPAVTPHYLVQTLTKRLLTSEQVIFSAILACALALLHLRRRATGAKRCRTLMPLTRTHAHCP
eukprot:1216052-Rhodomonas_salina.1